ncbi:MAG: ATP-binding protein [Pseudoflavonifractor sp.]|nr:ATP-binding protein [Alloprevotella sp.]MCM1117198.1 ATP-binding protein [Pseudoflavonifractor sp.]
MMRLSSDRRLATLAFLLTALAVVGAFLYVSNQIVTDLAAQERSRMQMWADATREIVSSPPGSDIDFPLAIVQANTTIPVLLTDDDGNIIDHRNYDLPEPADPSRPLYISEANRRFLLDKLEGLKGSPRVIHIEIMPGLVQHLYYGESHTLRMLSLFPYIQVAVMTVFILVVYLAVSSSKRAEQNKVWVGLSKETAHQLGTPISSLMAWVELLPSYGVDPEVTDEMDKDVHRLASIASRFSKIGSRPALEPGDVNATVSRIARYMRSRISSRVTLSVDEYASPLIVAMSEPLLEWVLENLIKNAVDAMDGHGSINISTSLIPQAPRRHAAARIDIADTGKGIPRRAFKTIFKPGFTTKSRGWGLGLTLAKRIVEQYHGGHIFVATSTPGEGSTFSITLPLLPDK